MQCLPYSTRHYNPTKGLRILNHKELTYDEGTYAKAMVRANRLVLGFENFPLHFLTQVLRKKYFLAKIWPFFFFSSWEL